MTLPENIKKAANKILKVHHVDWLYNSIDKEWNSNHPNKGLPCIWESKGAYIMEYRNSRGEFLIIKLTD
jgi:hypothetical protein